MPAPATRSSTRTTFEDLARSARTRGHTVDRLGQARLVAGSIRVDRRNRLRYEAEVAGRRGGVWARHAVVLDGTWGLTRSHDLALTLRQAERDGRETLYLKGVLEKAEAHALIFALERSGTGARRTSQQLRLSGRWSANADNRLVFLAEKSDGSEDRLTLQGGWELGDRHELLYRYRQRETASRVGTERTLAFSGAWDVTGSDRLVYRIEGSTDSAFEFRGSLRSPSLAAGDGRLIYDVGIGLAGSRGRRTRVVLSGAWKLHRDLSVSFEMPVAGGRAQAIRFEGAAALSGRDRIGVALSTRHGEPLGLTVTFTRELVPDAGLFLRLRRDEGERSVVGGIRVRF
jgi:hypothetical protein